MIRQQTLHDDAAVGVEDHDHAQGSAAVFAADACLMATRLRSHAAAQPEGPAAIQAHEPFHAIERRSGFGRHSSVMPHLAKVLWQRM